ncbi:unnamed protein product [Caenorhabditis sp. 36 PRJEB53466]|nr:unnamed protein product [Caenorhabditis sp. 36 PRJEB53466]
MGDTQKKKKKKKTEEEEEELRIVTARSRIIVEDLEEAEQKYQAVVAYCKHFNTTFNDGEFPRTFFKLTLKKKIKLKKISQTFTWIRPVEYRKYIPIGTTANGLIQHFREPPQWSVMDNPTTSEVSQSLPNCGFVAALAVVGGHPDIVNALIPRNELSEYGVYQVRLCVDGEWKTILVDDWFPTANLTFKTAHSLKMQLWPFLVEKALAKAWGGYKKLKGTSMRVLDYLTGAPVTETFWNEYPDDPERLWMKLLSARASNFLMTCATSDKVKWSMGLVRHHAYSLLDVVECNGHRLLYIRNTWAIFVWKGKWSDWTGGKPSMAGAFWIEYEDFLRNYYTFVICRYRPAWSVIRMHLVIDGPLDGSQKMIEMTVPRTCDIAFTCNKPGHYDESCFTWIFIYSAETGEFVRHTVLHQSSSDDFRLPQGTYHIMLCHVGTAKTDRNVAVHSAVPICVKLVNLNYNIAGAFQQSVLRHGRCVRLSVNRADVKIYKFCVDDKHCLVMAENLNSEMYLHVHLYCNKIMNLDDHDHVYQFSRQPTHTEDWFADVIPPMSRQILLIVCCEGSRGSKKQFPIDIDYHLSNEKVTKLGRNRKAEHVPEIHKRDHIHQTTVI